jgi:hypothetical protein
MDVTVQNVPIFDAVDSLRRMNEHKMGNIMSFTSFKYMEFCSRIARQVDAINDSVLAPSPPKDEQSNGTGGGGGGDKDGDGGVDAARQRVALKKQLLTNSCIFLRLTVRCCEIYPSNEIRTLLLFFASTTQSQSVLTVKRTKAESGKMETAWEWEAQEVEGTLEDPDGSIAKAKRVEEKQPPVLEFLFKLVQSAIVSR